MHASVHSRRHTAISYPDPPARLVHQFIDRYLLGDRIHSSTTCTVIEATDVTENNKKVVVKLMSNKDQYEKEAGCADMRNGEHIIEIINGSVIHDSSKKDEQLSWAEAVKQFGFDQFPYGIVMPRAQRTLMLIMKTERLDPDGGVDSNHNIRDPDDRDTDGVRRCFRELAACLEFMHEKGVIHGDVKPLNCGMLLKRDGTIKRSLFRE